MKSKSRQHCRIRIGFVFCGWCSVSMDYVILFAIYWTKVAIEYKKLLLSRSPLEREALQDSAKHVDFLDFALHLLEKTEQNVLAFTWDIAIFNCSLARDLSMKFMSFFELFRWKRSRGLAVNLENRSLIHWALVSCCRRECCLHLYSILKCSKLIWAYPVLLKLQRGCHSWWAYFSSVKKFHRSWIFHSCLELVILYKNFAHEYSILVPDIKCTDKLLHQVSL